MRAEQVLPDDVNQVEMAGVMVRKGTIGAFLRNARVWTDPASDRPARETAERDIVEAVPALEAVGLFEVLEVRDAKLRALIERK